MENSVRQKTGVDWVCLANLLTVLERRKDATEDLGRIQRHICVGLAKSSAKHCN